MLKTYYKRKNPLKVFFDKDMSVRSYAYGSEVQDAFIRWEEYFFGNQSVSSARFKLSSQGNILGNPVLDSKGEKTKSIDTSSLLPPLAFDSQTFEMASDGWIRMDETRTAVNAGTELKAWAIAAVPHIGGVKSALFVIGKPNDESEIRLVAYELTKRGLTGKIEMSVPLEASLDAKSYLICLGRHIFLVHNSKLDYYYYRFEKGELERVAIGKDGDNSAFPWCQYVGHNIVADKCGTVYWTSENQIYGFKIGYPRKLFCIDCPVREELLGIRAEAGGLLVFRRDRNTAKITANRYIEAENGRYEGRPVPLDGGARVAFVKR